MVFVSWLGPFFFRGSVAKSRVIYTTSGARVVELSLKIRAFVPGGKGPGLFVSSPESNMYTDLWFLYLV